MKAMTKPENKMPEKASDCLLLARKGAVERRKGT